MQERASQNSANLSISVCRLPRRRLHRVVSMTMSRPNPGATERFIRRASEEGIAFSRDVKKARFLPQMAFRFRRAGCGTCCPAHCDHFQLASFPVMLPVQRSQQNATQAQQQLEQLTRQNSTPRRDGFQAPAQPWLSSSVKPRICALNWQRKVWQRTSARHDKEQALSAATLSASHNAQSLEEAEAQRKMLEKQLADTEGQLARLNQARASDQADLVAAQAHINELSEQLKTATTNIDMERQLASCRQRRSRS